MGNTKKNGCSPKEKKFAIEFLKDGNATQAAIRAGYSKKSAGELGSRLLKKVKIQALVESSQDKAMEKAIVTLEEWLKRLRTLAMKGSPYAPTTGQALRMIGTHFKWLTEKVEHSGPDGGPVEEHIVFEQRLVSGDDKEDGG